MSVVLKSPINGETADLCARHQREFDECRTFREIKKLILSLDDVTGNPWDNTTPKPVEFIWESDSGEALLEISENASFEDADRYSVHGSSFRLFNIKKDTRYYWRINGCPAESFVTDSVMPRWLKIDGIGNVRDFGGRRNTDGARIRQGLIYRGFKLEDDLTDAGRDALRREGIRTELDLRKESAGVFSSSCIDESVRYVLIPCHGYDEFALNDIKNGTCRKLIEFFADKGNYPIYFHCHGGQDRTGTVAFLLGAIAGLDDEALLREYELTMLSAPEQKISRSRKKKIKPFLKYLRKNGSRKASLGENALTFLKNAGVSDETITLIRDNLLEKAR